MDKLSSYLIKLLCLIEKDGDMSQNKPSHVGDGKQLPSLISSFAK